MPTFDSIDHLNYEAVAALIDDELSPTALHRAHQHLALCPDCRREVAQQRAAAEAVREHNTDGCLRAPRSLVERLAHLGDAASPAADPGPAPSASKSTSSGDLRTSPTRNPAVGQRAVGHRADGDFAVGNEITGLSAGNAAAGDTAPDSDAPAGDTTAGSDAAGDTAAGSNPAGDTTPGDATTPDTRWKWLVSWKRPRRGMNQPTHWSQPRGGLR